MKEKIVAIVVLMLMATTVASATNGLNMKVNNEPKPCSVNVPVLKKGDSWTYNLDDMGYGYDGSTLWFKQNYNYSLTWTVVDDTGANYTFKVTSKNMEGRHTIGSYQLKYTKLTKITYDIIERKTDLGELRNTRLIKGPVIWLIGGKLPFPAQFQYSDFWTMTPAWVTLPFPFNAGTPGTLQAYHGTVGDKCSLYWGLITLINDPSAPFSNFALPYQCEMANITVPPGTYNAYNVSVDLHNGPHGHYSWWQYYVPDAGADVKYYTSSTTASGLPSSIFAEELVSTNYTP